MIDDEREIIDQEEVRSSEPKRIKIKIKERVSKRKQKRVSLPLKIIFLLFASFLGFYFGSRIVEKYIRYWAIPNVRYYSASDPDDAVPTRFSGGQSSAIER